MGVISHGVLVFLVVFVGWPITIVDDGPNPGKVARQVGRELARPGRRDHLSPPEIRGRRGM